MKRVIVHIDRLVLKGFRHEDRLAVAEGLQQELGRVLSAQHLHTSGDIPRLRVGGVDIDSDSRPQHVGVQVAQGIGKEMKP